MQRISLLAFVSTAVTNEFFASYTHWAFFRPERSEPASKSTLKNKLEYFGSQDCARIGRCDTREAVCASQVVHDEILRQGLRWSVLSQLGRLRVWYIFEVLGTFRSPVCFESEPIAVNVVSTPIGMAGPTTY